mmetsp:Transcript_5152/g.16429  ORF Transcript_5152/g.16429 Transcript_5152/m.16429 type:complete len:97 (+) Transcript_5152:182-472(+)
MSLGGVYAGLNQLQRLDRNEVESEPTDAASKISTDKQSSNGGDVPTDAGHADKGQEGVDNEVVLGTEGFEAYKDDVTLEDDYSKLPQVIRLGAICN